MQNISFKKVFLSMSNYTAIHNCLNKNKTLPKYASISGHQSAIEIRRWCLRPPFLVPPAYQSP